jgi:5-methylcytosine-specific restriction protein B
VNEYLNHITKEDIKIEIQNYEQSDFSHTKAKSRYFTCNLSDYYLPVKFIIKEILNKKRVNYLDSQFTTNIARNILQKILYDENITFIDTGKKNPFLDLYKEIALKLLNYEDEHDGLIDILSDMKEQGLNTISLKDLGKNGDKKLSDIDPFTFFATFNRSITPKNRANILKYLKDDWGLQSKIPTSAPNIPWMQNQKAWFFGWEKDRDEDDINRLWKFFKQIINDNIDGNLFNRILQQQGINNTLSFGLFWIDSDNYITTDSETREYLKKRIPSYDGKDLSQLKYNGYINLLNDIRSHFPNISFYEIVALKNSAYNEEDKTNKNNPAISTNYKTKNTILYGVPGVGKTHNVKNIISMYESGINEKEIFAKIEKNIEFSDDVELPNDRVEFITFHQSFAYEDFIEGFRPNDSGKIVLQDGIFKNICDKARDDKENNYYLVIDEINRGNISKKYGELITLIEEDKREVFEVKLPYSKKSFSIPKNLFIIATMNSTDKSIALIDIALRRRFAFLKLEPNLELIKWEKARELLKKLNESLDSERVIGHSYFMDVTNQEDLEFVLRYKITPLLEEYFYGDENKLDEIKSTYESML